MLSSFAVLCLGYSMDLVAHYEYPNYCVTLQDVAYSGPFWVMCPTWAALEDLDYNNKKLKHEIYNKHMYQKMFKLS